MPNMPGKIGQKIDKSKSKRYKEYYQNLYPNYTEDQCEKLAENFRRQSNYTCIEYWQVKYPEKTLEECEQLRKSYLLKSRKSNPNHIEYYIERYPNLSFEEQNKLKSKHTREGNYQCIEFYLKKYPDKTLEECEQLRQEAVKEYTSKRDQNGEHNGMHHSKTSVEKRRSVSPRCIEFYLKKYPDKTLKECEQLRQEFIKYNNSRIKNAVKPTNLEYYLNQGMSEEEAKIALYNRQCTFSLEKCIKKYGEDEGKKRFQERQEKWIKSLKTHFIKEGINNNSIYFESVLQNKIVTQLIDNGIPIETEYYLFDKKTNNGFSYDIRYKNKLIEIQGDYWHANPKFYKANDKIRSNIVRDIWKHDKIKNKVAKKFGYEIIYIWESDYNLNPEIEINKCLDFLNDN